MSTMRAWRFHEPGPIENLVLEECPRPEPGPDEVLVQMTHAALNPADHYLVMGQYPRAGKPPFTPGRDGCGVVAASNSERFKPGDRVVTLGGATGISRLGTLAEYAAMPAAWLAPIPEGWTPEEAAAGPLVYLTAWLALARHGELKDGQHVLVTGASGGVGTAAVMLAKGLGARVAALSRNPEKQARLRELGADWTFDTDAGDLEKQVKAALDGAAIDLVVENLGGPFLNKSLRMAGYGGRVMVVGLLAGLSAEVVVGLLIHKCLRVQGLSVSSYAPDEAQAAWADIVKLIDRAGQRPLVDRVYPMTAVREGFAHLGAGPFGKIVVDIAGA